MFITASCRELAEECPVATEKLAEKARLELVPTPAAMQPA
jgi:hypothetical protein